MDFREKKNRSLTAGEMAIQAATTYSSNLLSGRGSSPSWNKRTRLELGIGKRSTCLIAYCSSEKKGQGQGVPNSNYVVPMDKSLSSSTSSCLTRPLNEILRDLNKRIPDNIITKSSPSSSFISWYGMVVAYSYLV